MPRRKASQNGNGQAADRSTGYSLEQQRQIKQAKEHFIQCEKAIADYRESMRDTAVNLKDKEIRPGTIAALRKHAKAIANGTEDKVRDEIAELNEVGVIIGNDLFAAAGVTLGEQRAPEPDHVVSMPATA